MRPVLNASHVSSPHVCTQASSVAAWAAISKRASNASTGMLPVGQERRDENKDDARKTPSRPSIRDRMAASTCVKVGCQVLNAKVVARAVVKGVRPQSHPRIVRLLDVFEVDDDCFATVMERVKGGDGVFSRRAPQKATVLLT